MKAKWVSYQMGSARKAAKNSAFAMKNLGDYPLSELKQLYAFLHSQVMEQPFLMDSELLNDLQALLQQRATQDGVDVSLHAEWAAWLERP